MGRRERSRGGGEIKKEGRREGKREKDRDILKSVCSLPAQRQELRLFAGFPSSAAFPDVSWELN